MTIFSQWSLFLSSYSPLFYVFALLNSFGKGAPTLACLVIGTVGLISPIWIFGATRKLANQTLKIEGSQIRDGDALAYIATYLIPFAAISAVTGRERLALAIFVVLIAILYVRSELFYVNPLFALVGYRMFQVSTPNGTSVVLLTRRRFLKPETTVSARRLSDYVWWEEKPE